MSRLLSKLAERTEAAQSDLKKGRWSLHAELERGNPVRVYEGKDFRQRV
jgi:hypothetical protein